ncbi:SLBB domain-containing protein [Paracidobacterium acidisoli]|uniref:Sugar transporter n=1 Tax=Paracidobacterium acidisoli TaxID=2303751 RepID=A0A372IM72_9BACT|nr:SLBB domain-containing protein [Paracidobacterium acidisoli]MBT9332271.1 SLBB domain-containing protein [Paracidobacterium acidisoli]
MKRLWFLILFTVVLLTPWSLYPQSAWDSQQSSDANCSAADPSCGQQNQYSSPILPNQAGQQVTPNGASSLGQLPPETTYQDNGNPANRFRNRYSQFPQQLPPQPLSEFQKFVASTTGQVLPVFGESLFRNVPSTFAPLEQTPVPPDYVIGPQDEIRIRVWGQVNFRANLFVDRAGEIYIPQVGGIHVAGLPFSQLDPHLRAAIGRIYRNFDLTADLGQIRAVQVYVTGEARRPGVYTVSSLSTLADALFASGGVAIEGSMRHIQLRRNGAMITDFDLYDLLVHGDKSKDVGLLSGDVIYIPPVGPEVAIMGSVRSPGIYELRGDESIDQALKDAGGVSAIAAESRISIERIQDHQSRKAMEMAFDAAGLATPLASGDILRVYSMVPMYSKTITLRGNTANPGRFGWHAGMHLSDLIPDRDSLITRDYWWKRTQLGLPAPEFQPLDRFPNLRQPSSPWDLPRNPRPPSANRNYNRNPYSRSTVAGSQQNQQYQESNGQYLPPNYNDPDSGDYYNNVNPDENPYDQQYPQDQYQGQYQDQNPDQSLSPNDSRNGQYNRMGSNSSLASQESNLQNPQGQGQTQTPKNDVRLNSPDIDWDYAVIERMDPKTLTSSLIPFDLGRLILDHDESQNLELQPGDVVTIFSQADIHVPLVQQTKYVRLEGEFVHSGIYSVHPGETLRQLVSRAGGLTPGAYLYGSEFTRESTRVVQQHRIDEYVQNLELEIQRGSLALAASPVSTSQDIASGAAAQNSEHELISRLRQMRATGRVVLELESASTGISSLPDIPLENGDHFIVPPVPATVNVVGAVYDQNSFLYHDGRRTGQYLRLAGGPDRDADTKHAFIIRADGSVVSRKDENGLWGNTFEDVPLNPGDTIVMPEKTIKPSALRGFLDWSQVFSQFALGAAAISVIHQ